MPLQYCHHNGRPGIRWGASGHCYTYTRGDPASMERARKAALRQAAAILAASGDGVEVRHDRLHRRGPDVPPAALKALRELYMRRARRLQALIRAAVKTGLGIRTDAVGGGSASLTAAQIAEAVMRTLATVTAEEQAELQRIGRSVVPYVAQTSTRDLSRLVGNPIPQWHGFDAERIAAELAQFESWNADLLVDVTDRYGEQVRQDIIRAVGGADDKVAESLIARFEMTERRADIIARDQTTKLSRGLERGRHRNLGIESYRWRTVGDGWVRELHRQREGVIFHYDDPPHETPDDGHPGTPILCRCFEEPVIAGLVLPDLGSPVFTNPIGGNPPPIYGMRWDPAVGMMVAA